MKKKKYLSLEYVRDVSVKWCKGSCRDCPFCTDKHLCLIRGENIDNVIKYYIEDEKEYKRAILIHKLSQL